jgi:2-(1,2-epoxy-1,2-dihydrophenyl)acetyl-CoA isomerase
MTMAEVDATRLHVRREHALAVWTLDGPGSRNALYGEPLFAAFEAEVLAANRDGGLRAVILTGVDPAFCSGGNTREMIQRSGMFAGPAHAICEQYRTGIQRIARALDRLEVPLIAAVNGVAIGAGCDLACMCDLRIASERASFAESFVKVGIVPGDGGAWLLPRVVGYARAAEMAFTGASVGAEQAKAIGLVSEVVEHGALMKRSLELAGTIAANSPRAVRWTKRLLKRAADGRLDDALEFAAAYQALAHHSPEHSESLRAMRERRPPRFDEVNR